MQRQIRPQCGKLLMNVLEITDTAVGLSKTISVRRTPRNPGGNGVASPIQLLKGQTIFNEYSPIHQRQHVSTDDVGMSKQRLSPYNAAFDLNSHEVFLGRRDVHFNNSPY